GVRFLAHRHAAGDSTLASTGPNPMQSSDRQEQSRLAWYYSFLVGLFGFAVSLFVYFSLLGIPMAALAGASALLGARVGGWLASLDGRSRYGLVACLFTILISPLMPPMTDYLMLIFHA